MSDNTEAGFWSACIAAPGDAANWFIFKDWLIDHTPEHFCALTPPATEEQRRNALLTAAREGHLGGWPLEALPALYDLCDIPHRQSQQVDTIPSLDYYAAYLDIAAAVTATENSTLSVDADARFDASRCTRLQANYLQNYRAGGANADALLADIRTELRKIPRLETLSDDHISGYHGRIFLDASGTGIKALPEGLHITGSAYFRGCGELTGASHIHAGGNADFRGCGELTGASHIHAGGNADFRGCGELTGASHIHAGQHANFVGCGELTGAHHIHAGGNADFRGCGKLTGAHHIHAVCDACFRGCGELTGVSHIHAGGDASFEACGALTGAHHIHACGHADFFGCGKLETLGEGCRIGQDLYLGGSGVTGLPEDIHIGGEIRDIPPSFTLGDLRTALDYKGILKEGKKDIEKEIISRLQQEPGEGVNDPNLTQGAGLGTQIGGS